MPTTYAIPNGRTAMDATTFTATGTTQTIYNTDNGTVGFKPDLVWTKTRGTVADHFLTDSVRGVGYYLNANTTGAEGYNSGYVTSFNTNGWTQGANNYGNTYTVVGWQWQAGQGTTSSNTSGSITSTVSANTTAGFSIVTYTGTGANATVGHGLGVAPSMIIVKARSQSGGYWRVYHTSLGASNVVFLNVTDASASAPTIWNSTAPTSSVFSIGTDTYTNTNGSTYVGYCWAAVPGFSAFGSYTGNGSTDGPFIYLGFRPKFLMWKRTDSTSSWTIYDTSRSTYNTVGVYLVPDSSGIEGTYNAYDFLSNGVKLRGNDASMNANGGTYIYAAFAENPFKYANAR